MKRCCGLRSALFLRIGKVAVRACEPGCGPALIGLISSGKDVVSIEYLMTLLFEGRRMYMARSLQESHLRSFPPSEVCTSSNLHK